ncbi:hypothetical protein ACB098_04G018000 [Castanea mollissima]
MIHLCCFVQELEEIGATEYSGRSYTSTFIEMGAINRYWTPFLTPNLSQFLSISQYVISHHHITKKVNCSGSKESGWDLPPLCHWQLSKSSSQKHNAILPISSAGTSSP